MNLFYLNLIRLIRKVHLKDFIESNVKNSIAKNSRKNSTNIMKKVPKEVVMRNNQDAWAKIRDAGGVPRK